MFLSDDAIHQEKDDSLGRAEFSKRLGEQILGLNGRESKVVGLYGDWGKGKTSILNIATSHIESLTQGWDEKKRPIIFRFNPWNFSEQEGLLFAFLQQLFSEVNSRLPLSKKDFRKNINSLARALGAFEKAPLAGIPLALTGSAMNLIVPEETVESLRKKIDAFFAKLSCKVIIVIDDIDRLTEHEIRLIFQLLKINANFPNTAYLVAFDRNIVEKALDSSQGVEGTGRAYLEKIIQVAFDIPTIESSRLDEILLEKLNEALKSVPEKRWNRERWINLYDSGFKHLFTSLRDVKRFVSSLSFTINMVRSEVNPVDFVGLEALRVFLPDVYHGIAQNKDLFTKLDWLRGYEREKQMRAEGILKIFAAAGERSELAKSICLQLFPPIGTYVGSGVAYSPDYLQVWRSDRRVCSTDIFDFYFVLGVPKGEMSKEEVTIVLETAADKSAFCARLDELAARGKLLRFLTLAQDEIAELEDARVPNIVESLAELGERISQSIADFSSWDGDYKIARLIYLAVMKLSVEARCSAFEAMVGHSDALYQWLFVVGLDSRSGEGSRRDAPLFGDECLARLKKVCALKIQGLAESGGLLRSPHLAFALFRWREWTDVPSLITDFVRDAIATPEKIWLLIRGFVYEVQVSAPTGPKIEWQINMKNVAELIDPSEVLKKLDDISSEKRTNATDEEKRAVETFRDSYAHWIKAGKQDDFSS